MLLDGLDKISGGFTREDQNPSLEPSRRAISQRREKNLVFLLFHAKDRPRLQAEALANLLRNHDPSEAIYGDLHACPLCGIISWQEPNSAAITPGTGHSRGFLSRLAF